MSNVVTYQERMYPSVGVWLCVAVVGALTSVATAPLGLATAAAVAVIVMALVGAALWWTSPVITVGTAGLGVGQALLPWSAVGPVETFTATEARQYLRTGVDPTAKLFIRGWIGPVVAVGIADDDPAAAWVISTRHPQQLATALSGRTAPGHTAPGTPA